MANDQYYGPYAGNILVEALGPILDRAEAARRLVDLPEVPRNVANIPKHVRKHYVMLLLDFHIPGLVGTRIYESIDLLLRQGYRYRDPRKAETWQLIGGNDWQPRSAIAPAMASVIVGHGGTGKTRAIERGLQCYPRQIIMHDTFPQMVAPHMQMAWLSVDIPTSGRRDDLAANLMAAWDSAVVNSVPGSTRRFKDILAKERRDGQKMLDEWQQVAHAHYLGVLHLDEIQNLFKLATLKQRRGKQKSGEAPELAIVEDETLRWIISLLNRGKIPVIFSGTLDGVRALGRRLSTLERIVVGGYHTLEPFKDIDSPAFVTFFRELLRYQYVQRPLADSAEFRKLVLRLTAGIPRIVVCLWITAHRIAFEREDDCLRLEDFRKAAKTFLAPLAPAVAALRSGDPDLMARYEDLLPRDNEVWASFWEGDW